MYKRPILLLGARFDPVFHLVKNHSMPICPNLSQLSTPVPLLQHVLSQLKEKKEMRKKKPQFFLACKTQNAHSQAIKQEPLEPPMNFDIIVIQENEKAEKKMKNNTLCVSSDEDEKGKEKKTEKYRDCVISRRIAGIPPSIR